MLRGGSGVVLTLILLFTPPQTSVAGENPNAKLAMYVIASAESLGCEDLVPADCGSIDVDISVAELFAADGYGYIVLLAYDIEEITSAEFALEGWPTGRGAPTLYGPYWCPDDPHTYGDHLDGGGATAFESCVQPDSNGIALLGYFYFGPLDSSDVPIDFRFLPSTYTAPEDSILAVTDCTEDFVVDEVVASSGCTIGGTYPGTSPDCGGEGDGGGESGGGEGGGELAGGTGEGSGGGEEGDGSGCWTNVVFLGPHALAAADTTPFYLGLRGLEDPESQEPDNEDYTWWVQSAAALDTVGMSYVDSVPGGGLRCFGQTVRPDTGMWEFYGRYRDEDEHLIGKFSFYENAVWWQYRNMTDEMIGFSFRDDAFEMTVVPGTVSLSSGQKSASFSRTSVPDSSLYDALDALGNVEGLRRSIPDESRAASCGLGNTYVVSLDIGVDNMVDVLAELYECGAVLGLHPLSSVDQNPVLSDTLPDDPLLDTFGLCCPHPVDKCKDWGADSSGATQVQWALLDWDGNGLNCPEAWGYDRISHNIRVGVLDQGIWWPNPEFGGDSSTTCGGDNVVQTGQDWVDTTGTGIACAETLGTYCWPNGHGTAMAGLIAARTNDGRGMAGVCWGNVELGAMRVIHGCGPPLCPSYWGEGWEHVFTVVGSLHACHVVSGSIHLPRTMCTGANMWLTTSLTLRAASQEAFSQDSVSMFFGAGNEDLESGNPYNCSSPSIVFPAALPWIESVTTTGADGKHYPYFWHGNCGFDSVMQPYGWIDFAAPPGYNKIPAPQFERCSRFWANCGKGTSHPDSLKYRMGKSCITSAATALSAGVGAMVIDAYIDSGRGGRPIPEDVYGIMEHSASPCWGDEHIPNAWEPNFHVGWGRLNAGLAVYDAMYADIVHHTGSSSWGQEEIGWFEWDCPAGDECNFPGKKVIAVAWRCMRLVPMPSGNRTGCWGHHRSPTSGTIPLLVDGMQAADVQEGLSCNWCDPMQYYRSADFCTLQTFVYYLFHPFDPDKSGKAGCPYEQAWVPVGLGDVTFSYTTLSSDRFFSSVDGPDSDNYGAHLPRPALEAFPRPSNPEINIRYSIPMRGEVSMCIYDVNGRLVRRLVTKDMEPGLYFATWDGRNETGTVAASGIYFCRLDVAGQHTVEKIVLLR